jgi:hypothetical protein
MVTKCGECGYEKHGHDIDEDGKYRDFDPEKEKFQHAIVDGHIVGSCLDKKYLSILICPNCKTIQFDGEI